MKDKVITEEQLEAAMHKAISQVACETPYTTVQVLTLMSSFIEHVKMNLRWREYEL